MDIYLVHFLKWKPVFYILRIFLKNIYIEYMINFTTTPMKLHSLYFKRIPI
jgi:hypothetical protein